MFKKHTNKRKNRSCATGTTNFAQRYAKLQTSHNGDPKIPNGIETCFWTI